MDALNTTLARALLSLALCLGLALCPAAALAGDAAPDLRHAELDGLDLVYAESGSVEPALVLVHCWGGDMSFWHYQVEGLSGEMRVITLDLPGHGASQVPDGPLTQELMARAVLAVMDAAGVETAFLAGHSMGASVVRQVALMAPERVHGLILVDGALFPAPATPEEEAAWSQAMQGFMDQFSGPDGENATAAFLESLHGAETPQEVRDWVRDKILATPAEVRISAMQELLKPEIWKAGPVVQPTLAVYAASPDSPPDLEDILRVMFPDLEYHFWVGPGHFFQLERPQELNALISGFISRHLPE